MDKLVKDRARRGRPALGKVKVMVTLDPQVLNQTDRSALACGVNRSEFIEATLRARWMLEGSER
jgi:hypothetical protein